jgi:rhomboid protease GluP
MPMRRFPLRESTTAVYLPLAGLAGLALALLAFAARRQLAPFGLSPQTTLLALALAFTAALAAARHLLRRRHHTAATEGIQLLDDRLRFPSGRELRYDAIDILGARHDGPTPFVLMGGDAGSVVVPFAHFADPRDPDALLDELTLRIAGLPDGPARLARIAAARQSAAPADMRTPLVTRALLGAILLAFAAQALLGALDNPLATIRLGGNAPALVARGDWYRLVSGGFLHGGGGLQHWVSIAHLLLNGLALYSLGGVMERVLGPYRYFIVYLVAGVAGGGASAVLARAPFAVGASAAIFGLLGALGYLQLRFRRGLPPGLRQSRQWWIFTIAVNGLLPVIVPVIDGAAHAGGFFAGALMTALLVRRPAHLAPGAAAGPALRLAAALSLVVCVLSLGRAATGATRPHQDDVAHVMRALTAGLGAHPELLNLYAWSVVCDPHASRETLDLALLAARRAQERLPDDDAVRDTLATALHRAGRHDEAITHERAVLHATGRAEMAAQLARFLDARLDAEGAPLVQGADATHLPAVRLEPSGAGAWRDARLVVEVPPELTRGATLFVVVRAGHRARALVVLDVAPGDGRIERAFADLRWHDADAAPPGASGGPPDLPATARLALYDARPDRPDRWHAWPADRLPEGL